VEQLDATAGAAIAKYVASQNLTAQDLAITYDGASKTVTVSGVARTKPRRRKLPFAAGNVHSVAKVDDRLTVAQTAAPASTFYEVKAGDTAVEDCQGRLWDANAYPKNIRGQQADAERPQ